MERLPDCVVVCFGDLSKKGQRLDIKDFKEAARHRSKKLQNNVVEGYNIMHLSMGYDGTKDYKIISSGLEKMENILNWCEANTGARSLAGVLDEDEPDEAPEFVGGVIQ